MAVSSGNPNAITSVSTSLHRPPTATISVMTSSAGNATSGVRSSEISAGSQIVVSSSAVMSSTAGGMVPVSQASNILHHVQNAQHILTPIGGQLSQQSGQGNANSSHQLSSPIIIRSQQGDFVIPGHISLGRGVQGNITSIRLI